MANKLKTPKSKKAKPKKLGFRLKKQTIRKLKRDRRVIGVFLLLLIAIGFSLGATYVSLRPYHQHPANIIWAADKSVTVPADLVQFLLRRNDCRNYRGAPGPTGVGLWGVYQVSHDRFAKISYGCSTNLSTYTMAVKVAKSWQIVPAADYFSTTGFLPKCAQVEKYQIDKSIEPYCIKDDSMARANVVQ